MKATTKSTLKQSRTKTQVSPALSGKQPRLEIRCVGCTCAAPGREGKLLGALLGVTPLLLEILRVAGVSVQLPCQRRKGDKRTVLL